MANKKTLAVEDKRQFLSRRQIEGVFKKLDIPVLKGCVPSVRNKPFKQFSLIKHVDVVVETSCIGER